MSEFVYFFFFPMKIELREIPIRAVIEWYLDDNENGVVGYGGQLNIRPRYQREFVYRDTQRDAVIETVKQGFPLNVMYWVVNPDGTYEVLDGQQRTISICQYVSGDFSLDFQYFHNLTTDEREQILDYRLMIYWCEGTDREKLDWFRTINIAWEKLTEQELRNAIYTGPWLTDAKRYFSKTGCAAYGIGSDYLIGSPIRQDYLETAISWISGGQIERYMSEHQHTPNAFELWSYYQTVITWTRSIFPHYRREMKGVAWGLLYSRFGKDVFDSVALETEISRLMQDEDVTKKSGIYEFVLSRNEKFLSIRAFTDKMKRESYERQTGICIHCQKHFELSEMETDHITPWYSGGRTIVENCQMLCRGFNRVKSGR